ncbi:MerR family DNA-binding transcriptional regulator [Streptomyces sp. AD55]|uniref:MerR family DNA-binding transcriptional regulator n=1 Tax=Streptomyces sp. AD55 TaxID=3242895 RepID=UPI0035284E9C
MFTIGDFARHGRVSVRMLRHYDATGLLPTVQAPAHWIDANGHRSTGHPREISLACPPDRDEWVTELQVPVVRA